MTLKSKIRQNNDLGFSCILKVAVSLFLAKQLHHLLNVNKRATEEFRILKC